MCWAEPGLESVGPHVLGKILVFGACGSIDFCSMDLAILYRITPRDRCARFVGLRSIHIPYPVEHTPISNEDPPRTVWYFIHIFSTLTFELDVIESPQKKRMLGHIVVLFVRFADRSKKLHKTVSSGPSSQLGTDTELK